MSPEFSIAIASLVVACATFVLATWIAFLGLRATAKPAIDFVITPNLRKHRFRPGERALIQIDIANKGHWYAKPAATNMQVYINVDKEVEPVILRSGWGKQYIYKDVFIGKGGARVLRAKGLHALYGELPERMEIELIMPQEPGKYEGWISSFSGENAHRIRPISFTVAGLPSESPNADMANDEAAKGSSQ